MLYSVLYLVKFHVYRIPHYFISFHICTSYYRHALIHSTEAQSSNQK